jgi:hypothetical protein
MVQAENLSKDLIKSREILEKIKNNTTDPFGL